MPSNLSPRIKTIQKAIKVPQTGDYDTVTLDQLMKLMNITKSPTSYSDRQNIQKKLGFSGRELDGIFGINTTTRLEAYVSSLLPEVPKGANMIVSKKGVDLIVESEISGESVYNSKYKSPIWPQSASGITIGIGYDLGYMTTSKVESDWGACLGAADVSKLKICMRDKGRCCKGSPGQQYRGNKKYFHLLRKCKGNLLCQFTSGICKIYARHI